MAQKPLGAGTALRAAELTRPDLVARGEAVTIVYETPGVALALRGQAREGGPLGAVIGVVNPVSKKVIQATVIGPGRVTVAPIVPVTAAAPAARLAAAQP
ncbi:flagellar basal body P-ring formation chaperone FlgA [Methylobacterium ajmalii]|uniref:flagellar basal body P-ring formation chaperone FlgA n=1 Tax=Methylobacterium ajmalii TaxID=2738439 RepID=UPI002FEE4296